MMINFTLLHRPEVASNRYLSMKNGFELYIRIGPISLWLERIVLRLFRI